MRPAERRQRTETHKDGDFRGAGAKRLSAPSTRAEGAQRRLFAAAMLLCEAGTSKMWRRQETGSRSVCGTVHSVLPPANGLSSLGGRAGAA
ncbi:hypothetical protein FA95DRAFT_1563459 [Auriscalpium vulgare]|uniref:Uncharacterized protein n=1 Tax=Auriscalpium vulgare TaxID=40419 RepID=A0ACB8RHA5_9AGAM|nr:hypothetical protein FA95DRAFT_1563459 [Auriscalpium vulgare]